ncbi:reductase [Lithospermum erythrorhizon]|uniref:Reductase n=1 Tax=Lithospermum erythrorhizon TaxID=34254 RepID=A0AAV3Q2J0_LITER
MNGLPDGKKFKLEKPVPGCLGRMVNIFDFGLVARNKLIADKPYSEGSSISRCQSDLARTNPTGDQNHQIEGEMFMAELRKASSNKTPNGTPMKTLIDQEMSKEIGYAHNPPSVVAKLMGLDALPPQHPDIATQRSHSIAHSRSRSDIVSSYWKEDGYMGSELEHEVAHSSGQRDYTDIYETCQKSGRSNSIRDKSPSKGRCDNTNNEKKMALVRQKFMEAKCLATDERLRQSKQFQDALEVLSANKDSFLKFLQEPNSLFSQQLYNIHSVPPTPETKRITVLKPSKMVDNCKFPVKNNEKRTKKTDMVNGSDKTPPEFASRSANRKADEYSSPPTRIVVLKPSPGRPHDPKSMASIPSSPRISGGEELFGEFDHDSAENSREVAMSIAHQMRENLGGQWRDENSISSMYPDGYIGDESSFNVSDTEYAAGNLSDSEVISPTSRHSWDYINRFDSPLSSSFSRASYSPESSVCREAKKRLSERWSMMSSNGSYQEPKHVRRNSSTLGEMLALSDIKKTGGSKEIFTNIDEPRASSSLLSSNLDGVNGTNDSHKNLVRSKSVPLSSTQSSLRLNVDIQDDERKGLEGPRNEANGTSSKSLFMGKVSSLFFSRNKKIGREKSSISQSRKEYSSGTCSSSPENFDGEAEYQGNLESNSSSAPLPFSSNQPSSMACSGKQISPELMQNP